MVFIVRWRVKLICVSLQLTGKCLKATYIFIQTLNMYNTIKQIHLLYFLIDNMLIYIGVIRHNFKQQETLPVAHASHDVSHNTYVYFS